MAAADAGFDRCGSGTTMDAELQTPVIIINEL
jgi:hypothetical protein